MTKTLPPGAAPVKATCPECESGMLAIQGKAYCPNDSCEVGHVSYSPRMALKEPGP